jgi:hypothetical protein
MDIRLERKENMNMKNGIADIDHLMCGIKAVRNADKTFGKMGFVVSPLSDTGLGVSNRCIVLTPTGPDTANYIELMGVTDPKNVRPEVAALISGDEGVKQIIHNTPDARAAFGELASKGFKLKPILDFQRQWVLPTNDAVQLAFSVVMPEPGPEPFPWILCQHHTVEHFHRDDLRNHPNGARTFTSVYCVSDNPEQDAVFYENLYGQRAVKSAEGIIMVGPSHTRMRILSPVSLKAFFPGLLDSPRRVPPYLAGFTVSVGHLRDTEAYFSESGLPFFTSLKGSLWVHPDLAHNMLIEFEPQTG